MTNSTLDIRPLLRVPFQVPARLHIGVRKKRIHAGFGRRRVEDELCLAVLLQDGVIMTDDYRSVRIAMGKNSQPEQTQIHDKCQDCETEDKQNGTQEDPPYSISQIERSVHHEARLYG